MRTIIRNVWSAQMLARHEKPVAAGLLAVLTIMFFRPVLFGGMTMLGTDFACANFGMKFFCRESILGGDFPFWCPYALSGQPLLAGYQYSLLYLPSLIWVIFPPTCAYVVFGALHQWMFAWFIYLLARECRAGITGAWFAAVCASCPSILTQTMECPEFMAGMVWLAPVIYFFLRLLRSENWRNTLGLALSGAMQVYAGASYALLMTLLALPATGLLYWSLTRGRRPLTVLLWRGALAVGLAFLLAAPQLLPIAELARMQPASALARDPQAQMFYSLLPADYAKTLVPTLFGYPMPSGYLYLGVLTVAVLAASAMLLASRHWRWNAATAGMLALAVTGMLLASGPLLGINKLFALLPTVSRLYNTPHCFIFMAAIALPVLAGLALRPLRRIPCRHLWWLTGGGLLVVLAVLLAEPWLENWAEATRLLPRYANDFKSFTAGADQFPIPAGINRFLALWVCSLAVLWLLGRLRLHWLALTVATLLLFVDKTFMINDQRMFGRGDFYAVETPAIKALREAGAGRELARIHKTSPMFGETHILRGSRDPVEHAWIRNFMPWAVGFPYHFYQTNLAMALNEPESDLWSRLLDRFEPWQNDRLRGLWNAKWIMDIRRGPSGYSYKLRENPQFMPRAWLSSRALPVGGWQEALRLLLDKNFDPRGTALLYAKPSELPEKLLKQNAGFSPVTEIRQTNNTISIRAAAGTDAVLVVADTYYKWWRAYVDGRPVRIHKVNMAQKAVLFPAGEHTVRFVCVPGSFYIGCGLFVLGAALIVWLPLHGRRRGRG